MFFEMMLVEVFENIFSKSYLLGCFQKFNILKITRYTVRMQQGDYNGVELDSF